MQVRLVVELDNSLGIFFFRSLAICSSRRTLEVTTPSHPWSELISIVVTKFGLGFNVQKGFTYFTIE
jgi:hypothetical protein